jgi:hypothetical protein
MKSRLYKLFLTTFFLIFINGIAHSQSNSIQCRITDAKIFMEKISVDGVKKVDFFIIGLKNKTDIKHFITTASSVERIMKVKVGATNKVGENEVKVTIAENGGVNDFRLMLMACSVTTIITPDKTFEVMHLPVKNANPFQ